MGKFHKFVLTNPEVSVENTSFTKALSNADEGNTSIFGRHGGSCSLQAGKDCVK